MSSKVLRCCRSTASPMATPISAVAAAPSRSTAAIRSANVRRSIRPKPNLRRTAKVLPGEAPAEPKSGRMIGTNRTRLQHRSEPGRIPRPSSQFRQRPIELEPRTSRRPAAGWHPSACWRLKLPSPGRREGLRCRFRWCSSCTGLPCPVPASADRTRSRSR